MNLKNNVAVSSLREVPRTGVIYVMTEAAKAGYSPQHPDWVNLGQGQPEAGVLEGAPPRVESIQIPGGNHEYTPVAGIWELRDAVASYYNRKYRRGMASQYRAENVSIASGGRASLTRLAAALDHINLGHFLPDYTAYEELLDTFSHFHPIPILLDPDEPFRVKDLSNEIIGRGLGALLISNPCNPTGRLVAGEELDQWVQSGRDLNCMMIFDEFYSHYIWDEDYSLGDSCSAAAFVEDVDQDQTVILDGLTKNWRYPGWRVAWTVGPREVIEAVASTGSYLDGGGSHPLQAAAVSLLEEESSRRETEALQKVFRGKRDMAIEGLKKLGIKVDHVPQGTFYVWGSLENLPEALRDGMSFFRTALQHKVITVPGTFFDVNPGARRSGRPSRFRHYMRFSFGAKKEDIELGLARLEKMIAGFQ